MSDDNADVTVAGNEARLARWRKNEMCLLKGVRRERINEHVTMVEVLFCIRQLWCT